MEIPQHWTDNDRREFLSIAQRRQFEHLLGYGVVAVGSQLFHIITSKQVDLIDRDDEDAKRAESSSPAATREHRES